MSEIIHPDDLELYEKHMIEDFPHKKPGNFQYRIITRDGKEKWIEHVCKPVFDEEGHYIGKRGSNRDITHTKKIQEALKASESHYRSLVENSLVGVFQTNTRGEILFANQALADILEYDNPDELKSISSIRLHKYPEKRDLIIKRLKKDSKIDQMELEVLSKCGKELNLIMAASINNDIISGMLIDVTQRKILEENLKEAEHRYRMVGQLISDFAYSCVQDEKDNYAVDWITDSFYNITGFSEDELRLNRCWMFTVHPDDEEIAQQQLSELKHGMYNIRTFRIIDSRGKVRWLRNYIRCVEDSQLGKLRIYGAAQDITQQRNYLDELRHELEINQSLSRIYPVLISESSTLSDIAFVVFEEAKKLTGSEKGYVSTIDPDNLDMVVHTHTAMMDECQIGEDVDKIRFPCDDNGSYPALWGYSLNKLQAFYTNSPANHPAAKGTPEGHIVLEKFLSVPVIMGEELVGQIALANPGKDYSKNDLEAVKRLAEFYALAIQRIRYKKKILDSLNEKELLLREIHHRVKNNLQIIVSLLNLQSHETMEQQAKEFCRVSQDRVRTMALVHEKLYHSHKLSNISIQDYIKSLAEGLFQTYVTQPGSITMDMDVDDVSLNLDTAIPLGLIINELLTNSLKYAFPNRKTGKIFIKCKSENDKYILTIADDGVGLPQEIEPEKTDTLGLKLVYSLVNQINGSMEIKRTRGTKFVIKFSELQYKNRI
ncbi:MAG: PAS domain S-box protein [Methanobacteriaceae archaeon]|nr:PAS domain S-box protein [Methanobacteriaceae archaeon]